MATITFLNGYKTYIAAGGMFLYALFQALGPMHDIPGAFMSIMSALGFAGLRSSQAATHAVVTATAAQAGVIPTLPK